jgi:hypothetical protein
VTLDEHGGELLTNRYFSSRREQTRYKIHKILFVSLRTINFFFNNFKSIYYININNLVIKLIIDFQILAIAQLTRDFKH